MTLILFGTFFALVALGVPISYALGLSSITTILTCVKALSINVFVQRVFAGINSFPLMCIACFILSGELLSRGNLTERIVRAANVFVGRIPGGLAHVNVLASMLFGGISGSANADVSSLGPIEIEMMTKAGYHREFSVAVTVASATIGIIIPPSIPMVIYATSAGKVSIADMFLAGMIPGILVGLAMMITCFIIAKRRNYPKSEKKSIRENMMAILRGIPPCFLFVIILGGVLSGIFTPTEASVIAVLYSFILTVAVYRSVSWRDLPEIFINSAISTSTVLILIGFSTAFSYLLAFGKIPQAVVSFIFSITQEPVLIYFMMFAVFLLVGTFMDTAPALIILVPIFLPLAEQCGMDPVQFGIFIIVSLSIGLYTPPVGACLFLGCNVGKVTIEKASLACIPFWFAVSAIAVSIVFIRPLTMWLPGIVR